MHGCLLQASVPIQMDSCLGRVYIGLDFTCRRRAWRSTSLQILQTVIFIFFIWVINKAVQRSYQRGSQYKDVPHPAAVELGQIPACTTNQYLRASPVALTSRLKLCHACHDSVVTSILSRLVLSGLLWKPHMTEKAPCLIPDYDSTSNS